ncbi:MAG: hypothetical protein DI537_41120 [Stutzerimonas stutzeri]|nr:MAG: hypothetical protein DI537_41120 [Stutzerimonas stutzeri]
MFFYSDHYELTELNEYLIWYQARKARVLDMQRQRLVHPFGDVDHFAVVYRHCTFFNDWLGIATPVARHRWRIPERLMWTSLPVMIDSPDYQSFVRNMQHVVDEGPKMIFDPEFSADVDELGSTRVVVESDTEFYLESDYSGASQDWHTKWTLLKIRWT